MDWLNYLAGNSQTAPTIFFHIFRIFLKNYFIKNPQTTNARTFLPLNISAVGSVEYFPVLPFSDKKSLEFPCFQVCTQTVNFKCIIEIEPILVKEHKMKKEFQPIFIDAHY